MLDAENLKIKIKTKAHEKNLEPQDIMQMYFFERLLYRISKSKYKNNFILKGGLLLSAIFGDERRTTQDMDMDLCQVFRHNFSRFLNLLVFKFIPICLLTR